MLDATKIVPEELVPLTPVGQDGAQPQPRQLLRRDRAGRVLRRAHRARASTSRNDPLLAGRIHSYVDTQISRLGGPELPRDPDQRAGRAGAQQPARRHAPPGHQPRPRRRTSPTRSAAAARSRRARAGFTSFREPIEDDKVRGKPERFADHYTQATLFWNSQTPVEKAHILRGFRFELTKVQMPAVRERVVAMLANVDAELAETLAARAGHARCRSRCRRALKSAPEPEVDGLAGAVAVRAPGRRQHPHAARRDPGRRRRRRRGGARRCTPG